MWWAQVCSGEKSKGYRWFLLLKMCFKRCLWWLSGTVKNLVKAIYYLCVAFINIDRRKQIYVLSHCRLGWIRLSSQCSQWGFVYPAISHNSHIFLSLSPESVPSPSPSHLNSPLMIQKARGVSVTTLFAKRKKNPPLHIIRLEFTRAYRLSWTEFLKPYFGLFHVTWCYVSLGN